MSDAHKMALNTNIDMIDAYLCTAKAGGCIRVCVCVKVNGTLATRILRCLEAKAQLQHRAELLCSLCGLLIIH